MVSIIKLLVVLSFLWNFVNGLIRCLSLEYGCIATYSENHANEKSSSKRKQNSFIEIDRLDSIKSSVNIQIKQHLASVLFFKLSGFRGKSAQFSSIQTLHNPSHFRKWLLMWTNILYAEQKLNFMRKKLFYRTFQCSWMLQIWGLIQNAHRTHVCVTVMRYDAIRWNKKNWTKLCRLRSMKNVVQLNGGTTSAIGLIGWRKTTQIIKFR